ncbi:hypothetical protein ACFWWC_03660 [Streptomyces sp. NPDC058642]|uniref:hypothetical protein n=1 Tax=Streptomyces sp. NPDC058642 TaxID=3346572 RepID=UPI00366733EA
MLASSVYIASSTLWAAAAGLYVATVTAWCSARYYAAHRRQLEEEAWEEECVLGRAPAPLDPCCMLARHSWGEAHALNCTDLFHRLTVRSSAAHPRSTT